MNNSESTMEDLPQLTVIITLPPADNPSKGKTITAFTLSDHPSLPLQQQQQQQPLHQQQLIDHLPSRSSPDPERHFFRLSRRVLLSIRRRRRVLGFLGITLLVAFILWSSVSSKTLIELRGPQDDDQKVNSFVFNLYPKKRAQQLFHWDLQVKLGRVVGRDTEDTQVMINDKVKHRQNNKLFSTSSSSVDSSTTFPVRGNIYPDGYEGALDPWLSSLWDRLYQMNPTIFPRGPVLTDPNMKVLDRPKFQIIYHDTDEMQSLLSTTSELSGTEAEPIQAALDRTSHWFRWAYTASACFQTDTANLVCNELAKYVNTDSPTDEKMFPAFFSDLDCIEMQIERARSMSPAKICHDKNKPHCFLQMSIEYQVGDVLEVLPGQNPAAIDAFIRSCNLNPNSLITVHSRESENCSSDSSTIPQRPLSN